MAEDKPTDTRPCVRFLQLIGIDADNPIDAKQLRETIRWAQEEQKARIQSTVDKALDAREKRNRNLAFIYGTGATVVSIIATALYTHFIGGH